MRTAAVEAALRAVPRHLFLPEVPVERAYADEAVPVLVEGGTATSSASQPSMVAIMLEQLAVRPGHRVLEIGAGTGYNAALLAHLVGPGGTVTTVDIDPGLVDAAAAHLRAAGVSQVDLQCGDGAVGHPAGAPYDRIVLTVASADVRPEWVAQLAPGGRLLLPLELRGSQLSVALDLQPDGSLRSDSTRSCQFIRLRGIGAGGSTTTDLPRTGLAVELPGEVAVDTDALARHLRAVGPARPLPVELGPADLWDGFGLWLALAEPATCRLLGGTGSLPGLLPVGSGGAALALPGDDGLAVVEVRRGLTRDAPWPARVRLLGRAGPALAARVVDAAAGWLAAGRPAGADLELIVLPRERPRPADHIVIDKPLSRVVVRLGRAAPGGGTGRA